MIDECPYGVIITISLCARCPKNPYVSTVPLTRPFACLLASLTHSFADFLARETVNDWMAIYSVFLSILDHSGSISGPTSKVCVSEWRGKGAGGPKKRARSSPIAPGSESGPPSVNTWISRSYWILQRETKGGQKKE